MVYKYSGNRSEFIFNGMPAEDTIVYSRKGGCFVSICRGISIAVLIFVFIFFLTFTIFFATKYAYDTKPNITLEDFLNHRPYIIDRRVRTPKHIIPKHYCLYIAPIFNETERPFSYNGIVWITILSKRHNTKRIEVNVKDLAVRAEDVSVYRSLKLTPLDFDDDPEWEDAKRPKRRRRDTVEEEAEPEITTTTEIPTTTTTLENETEGAEGEEEEMSGSSTPSTPKVKTNKYHHPALYPDDYVPIKITDVEYDDANDRLFIYLGTEMKKDIYYIVKIAFWGNMTHDRGLYFTTYEDSGSELSYFTATFLEPDARVLFPCLEDHNIQTPYDISIARHESMSTQSIADLEEAEILNSTWFVDEYNRTNSVRASEIGFVVTNMKPKVFDITPNITFIFYTREKYVNDLESTVQLLPTILDIYETYLGAQFPNEKVKYIAVPNGANEQREVKDSMILSSEHHILFSHFYPTTTKQSAEQSLAYEIALEFLFKTYEWTDNEQYWVYEALPLFLQNIALDQLSPLESHSDHLIIGDRFQALRDEVNFKSTALNVFDWDWDEVEYYSFIKRKGFAVLRMLNHTLGEDAFQLGVKKFISERLNRESSDFYECLAEAAHNLSTPIVAQLNVQKFLAAWISADKYPILSVTRHPSSGSIYIEQVEYSMCDETFAPISAVPISLINGTDGESGEEIMHWVNDNVTIIEGVFDPEANDSWVVVNSMGVGYYRVNYEPQVWEQFAELLKENPEQFRYMTRALLIDDSLNLARLGLLNYSIAFKLVEYLKEGEDSYYPWKETFENLKFLYNILQDQSSFPIIEQFMMDLIKPIYEKKILNPLNSEEAPDIRFQFLIYDWACLIGYGPCIEAQRRDFNNLAENGKLRRSQKSLEQIYLQVCTTIRYSGQHEWNIVLDSLLSETADLNYKKTLLRALGCTREINLVYRYLKFLTDDELSKLAAEITSSLSENKVALKYALDYLLDNWSLIIEWHDLNEISVFFNRINNRNEFEIFREIFARYHELFSTRDKETLRSTRTTILKTLEWKKILNVNLVQ